MTEEKGKDGGSGLIFVACMFIGGGLGLAFGRPDVGGAIGMGIGFLLMAFVRTKAEPVEVKIPSSASGYFLILLGIALIVTGPGLIYYPNILYPYIAGILIALLAVGLIIFGSKMVKRGTGSNADQML